MNLDLHIEGLDELVQEFEKLEKEMPGITNEALIAGGDLLKDEMIKGVYRHGLTRRSGEAEQAIIRTDPKNGEIFVGTEGGKKKPGFYLYMHEFGYFNVVAQRFIAPRPFASIVFENSKWGISQAYINVYRKGMGIS